MVELGNRTGWKRDASDGGSRNERTSVGRLAGGQVERQPRTSEPAACRRRARAIIPLGTTIGELALASSLFVYRMGKNLLIFQVMAANY